MKIFDAWYFKNEQYPNQVLQSNFFSPISHLAFLYSHTDIDIQLFHIECYFENRILYSKDFDITKNNAKCEITSDETKTLIRIPLELQQNPSKIIISYKQSDTSMKWEKLCKYAKISGKVANFSGEAFPSAIVMYRYGFDKGNISIGCWTDNQGEYAITIPCGTYNAFYCDDNSYGKSTLECWGWNIFVEKDRIFNFSIGNGEVYSINIFTDNGGMNNLFIVFRPMSLIKKESTIFINNKQYNCVEVCPELEIKNIKILLNGKQSSITSLQKFYNTSSDGIAIANYIAQIEKQIPNIPTLKQFLELSFSVIDENNNLIQGKAFTEFQFQDICATKTI